ncbi:MAG: hypothetical protein HOK28_10495 [Deltaproteobacteria bacterium]|nr:hypothetical protein [Deltaproteobacteria bacterium]
MILIRIAGLAAMWFLLSAAAEPAWEYKVQAGGEISEAPHGVLNLGLRHGEFVAQLYTDTLDLRWNRELGYGRLWLGSRFAAFAAELFIAPWQEGRYAPEQGVLAMYGELSTGYVHYLPAHFYAGVQLEARRYQFKPRSDVVRDENIPANTWRLNSATFIGYWTDPLKARVQAGLDYLTDANERLTPWLQAELLYHPKTWLFTPFAEFRGGLLVSSSGTSSSIIRFRFGGMNPYAIPLAGWSWGEAWAQYYAAGRVGVEYNSRSYGASVFSDYAYLAQGAGLTEQALGVGGSLWWILGDWRLDLSSGYAPVANRAQDAKIPPVSGWIAVGREWDSF